MVVKVAASPRSLESTVGVGGRVDEVLAYPLDPRTAITVVDLRAGYRIGRFDLQAKVENLFQNSYVDVQERSPGRTRSFRLTVTPRF